MIDLRYHIYSLTAVFFALAVGILIGTSFGGRSLSSDTSRRTIQSYENSMRLLKQEIESKTDQASQKDEFAKNCEEFCKAVLPIAVKGRLAWRNVAIIQTGDRDELTGTVTRALELAGANVTSVTDVSQSFPFDDEQKIAKLLADCGVKPSADGKSSRDHLLSAIADAICTGKHADILPKLEQAGVAKFTSDYDRYNKFVVLVGGAASEEANIASKVDEYLIAQLDRPDLTVVACEDSAAASSYVSTWSKTGIATVDNIETALGQASLICALTGENANFGSKSTADRLIPQTLETK